MQEFAVDLGAEPKVRLLLISTTIKHDDGRGWIFFTDIGNKEWIFLIHRPARLLPLAFNDQVVRVLLRMIDDEVANELRVVDTARNREMCGEDRLL